MCGRSAFEDEAHPARYRRWTAAEEGLVRTAQVIVANGAPYVVDCGNGVARQPAFAGVPLPALDRIFITHQHSDHAADYGNLSGWRGRRPENASGQPGTTGAQADDASVYWK